MPKQCMLILPHYMPSNILSGAIGLKLDIYCCHYYCKMRGPSSPCVRRLRPYEVEYPYGSHYHAETFVPHKNSLCFIPLSSIEKVEMFSLCKDSNWQDGIIRQ